MLPNQAGLKKCVIPNISADIEYGISLFYNITILQ